MQALQHRMAGRCCCSAHRAQALPSLPVRNASKRAHRLYPNTNTPSSVCRVVASGSEQPQQLEDTAAQVVQEPEQLQSAPLLPAPVQRILTRRSVKYEEDLHKPLGLVLFGAYVLGSASSVAGAQGCCSSNGDPRRILQAVVSAAIPSLCWKGFRA
jgi:hypothetical protein